MRFERVVRTPSMIISVGTGEKLFSLVTEASREKREYHQRMALSEAYRRNPQVALQVDPAANSEEIFVEGQKSNSALLTALSVETFMKFTFLSDTENMVFESTEFTADDLPKNINRMYARADGLNKFLEIKLKLRLRQFADVDGWLETQIVVQGSDSVWVNASAKTIEDLLQSERLTIRGAIYQNARLCFWGTLVLAWSGEFSIFHHLHPTFNFDAPLSGFGAIALFAVLIVTMLGWGNIVIATFTYLFPYCEITGNFTRSRTSAQTFAKSVFSALLVGGIVNAIHLFSAPLWKW